MSIFVNLGINMKFLQVCLLLIIPRFLQDLFQNKKDFIMSKTAEKFLTFVIKKDLFTTKIVGKAKVGNKIGGLVKREIVEIVKS